MTPPIAIYLDGVKLADGSPEDDPTAPYVIDGLTVTWGRTTTIDQPAASTNTFVMRQQPTWEGDQPAFDGMQIGRRIDLYAGENCPVFVGSITDLALVWNADDELLWLTVTADDVLADLGNRPSASTPWAREALASRAANILNAARNDTPITISTDIRPIILRKLDVDEGADSMVAEQLADIAASVDAVLWATVDADGQPALFMESPALRAPLRRLAKPGALIIIEDVSAAAGAMPIDPCIPNLDPVEFRQTGSDMVTGVSVTYYIPDPEDSSAPDVGVTTTIVDQAAESPDRPWGVRRMTLDSQLTTAADAQEFAGRIVGRLSSPQWRITGLAIDTEVEPTLSDVQMQRLLNMRTRNGLPVTINPLPAWAPLPSDTFAGYVEGGEIASIRGYWSCVLTVSSAQSFGGASAKWDDLPADDAWCWDNFDPDIVWADLNGVAGPVI